MTDLEATHSTSLLREYIYVKRKKFYEPLMEFSDTWNDFMCLGFIQILLMFHNIYLNCFVLYMLGFFRSTYHFRKCFWAPCIGWTYPKLERWRGMLFETVFHKKTFKILSLCCLRHYVSVKLAFFLWILRKCISCMVSEYE